MAERNYSLEPALRFVDEQRRGPYRRWIHTHSFEAQNGGTLCRDVVQYAVPGGSFVNWLLVRRDVEQIFAYRRKALRGRFPTPDPSAQDATAASTSPRDDASRP